MRTFHWVMWTALIAMLAAPAAPAPARAQAGYDRPGGDYTSVVERTGDPASCAARCERDARCRAWSFSYPGVIGTNAVCWLKNRVVARVENSCCISGVKGAGVIEQRRGRDRAVEVGIDRLGGDYRQFDTPSEPSGAACKAACEGETRCRIWTYVRPGYLGPGASARCYLKDQLRPPRRRPCCVSGVVR
jgi:hypothetical protein